MIDQLRAELLKVRSTRTTLGLLAAMIVLTLLVVILMGVLSAADSLVGVSNQQGLFAAGGIGVVFASLTGVFLTTSEYRHGTIRPTFLFTPRRDRVLAAKLLAGALTGLLFGVITVGLSFGIGSLILSARGIPAALDAGQMTQLTVGGVGAVMLFGIFGIGLGAIVRNQVAGVIGLLAWDFVVNPLLIGLAPKVGRFMPTLAGEALSGDHMNHVLRAAPGGFVLAGWTVLLAVLGVFITARRDVL